MTTLKIGSKSPQVTQLQQELNRRGAIPPLRTDEAFGPRTESAVKTFQQRSGLTVDGIAGPRTLSALGLAFGNPANRTVSGSGFAVSLTHAEKYSGKVLGLAPYQGECAAGVQQVFSEAGITLGLTRTWKPGTRVRGGSVTPGTAIASFKNGQYWRHAAILIREVPNVGLEVWDQWVGRPWNKRTLHFTKDDNDGSNNGNLFYVITR